MCCSTIRVPGLKCEIAVFVMIDLLHHPTYHIQKSSNNLIFTWETFCRSFPSSHPTNNPLQYHFYISSTRYLTFYIPVICSERKSSPMYMIDGTVPQLNSIRTRPWFVFLSNCDVVDVVFYSFYSQMKSWYLIHFDSIQGEVSLRSEHASPNTRRHRG